jgi:SulP family sulfate permease
MPALVAIMIMVSIGTFSWSSVKALRTYPLSSNLVMIATVAGVIITHNLAIGVLIGVILSGVFFAWKVSNLFTVTSSLSDDERSRTYAVEGQLFFASAEDFMKSFDFREALTDVTLDLSDAHVWDISAVQAVDLAVMKFEREGATVTLIGMNKASETLMDRLGAKDGDTAGTGH